jgi:hypothetical protein
MPDMPTVFPPHFSVFPAAPAVALLAGSLLSASALEPCRIQVVDKENGWPVPLVELRTTHGLRFVTDNAGLIACDAPELMGRETWFGIIGHGYGVAKDGFGMHGVRITPHPGGSEKIEVTRTNLALRVGRITGAGIFAESQKLGLETSWTESCSFGCDSLQLTTHDGKLHWLWGDTVFSNYPLGVFDMTGATTRLQPLDSPEPPLRLKLDYFRDPKGLPAGMVPMPGGGPTWASGLISIPDKTGTARLVCSFSKIKPPLDPYETGLAVWNSQTSRFEKLRSLWTKSAESPRPPAFPEGHVVRWKDAEGHGWLLFGDPFPVLKCPDTFEAWSDPTTWQKIDAPVFLKNAGGGKEVKVHRGGIAWNSFRKRWVTVFTQDMGSPSAYGEIWYAESKGNSPLGPWGAAVKVLTHEDYTFYNPILHPEFASDGSPLLYFEGTYTRTFSGNHEPTPRYEYNQMLYRLDLSLPALAAAGGS